MGPAIVILRGCRDHARKEVVLTIKRDGDVVARKRVPLEERSRCSYVYETRRTGQHSVVAANPSGIDHARGRHASKSLEVLR